MLQEEINEEEKKRIELTRPFEIPDFRAGDQIEFHMQHSISEGKGNTIEALCLGRKKKKKYNGAFYCCFNFGGVRAFAFIHHLSPMLAHFALKQKGSGNLQSKLYRLWDRNTEIHQKILPVIRNGVMKRREGEKKTRHRAKKGVVSTSDKDEYEDHLLG